MDIGSDRGGQFKRYSLRSAALLIMVFFLIISILTALVVVPKFNQVLESQNAQDIQVDLALEAALFEKYIESQKAILEDLAQFPSLVNAAMLSDSSNPVLIDFFENVVIGGESGRIVLQDIGGSVVIKSVSKLRAVYGESEPWVDQIVDGTIPYHLQLLDQMVDRISFKLSIPVKYNNFIEGILSAEINVSLKHVFVTLAFDDHIAFKLVQGDTTISTNTSHIDIAHEEFVELMQPNLTFVYITDRALIERKERIVRNTVLLVLLAGFAVSFLLFVVYGYRTESADDTVDRGKKYFNNSYIIPVAVVGIGFATSFIAYLVISYSQREAIDRGNLVYSREFTQHLQERIRRDLDVLNSLTSFYNASDKVTQQSFDAFTESFIVNNPNIKALAWLPNVTSSQRLSFEEQGSLDGIDNLKVRELGANKKMQVASSRDQYFPAYYIAPMAGHEEVIGFDMGSQDARFAALSKAGRTGVMVATPPVELVDGTKTQAGILVFHPVYSGGNDDLSSDTGEFAGIKGFVLLVLRADDVVAEALVDYNTILSIFIQDITDSKNHSGFYGDVIPTDEMTFSQSMDIAGRTWKIDVTAKKKIDQRQWVPWLVLISGLIVSTLMAVGLVHLIRRREMVEALVMKRTAELRTLSSSVECCKDSFLITQAGEHDPENGLRRIIYVNAAFTDLTGFSTNEIIGKTPGIIQGEKTDKVELAKLRSTIQEGGTYRGELMIYPKNGVAFWVDVNAAPIEDNDGRIVQFVTVLRSIADRKLADEEREELISRLTDSNEELQRFAYVCSHDLQEPLRMIRSFSEKLQTHLSHRLRTDEKGNRYLSFITDGAERAQQLISDILAYSSVNNDMQKLERIQSRVLVDNIIENMASSLEECGGRITYGELPEIQGNKTQLYQLFQNLINNAVKYRKPHTDPRVHLSVVDAGKYWKFSIKDNGIGISQRHLHKIFDVFQRLHRRNDYAGTGIGLSICKKIVERHSGTIWVKSEPGVGSTFYITLLKPIVAEIINERKAG